MSLSGMLDAVPHRDFIRYLALVDAAYLATTCKRFRGLHVLVFVFPTSVGLKGLTWEHRWGLSDTVVESVRNLLSASITAVNLEHCRMITDHALDTVATNCPAITKLNVAFCTKLTDVAIMTVAANCKNLTSLDVAHCTNLTDIAIKAVAANCPALASLGVCGLVHLTDASIKAIAAHCPSVTSFSAEYCNITDAAIYAIVQNCPLRSISLDCCPNLDETRRIHKFINY
mmetsp:Transcript_6553/g.20456  ORF Transcript_6553/g.20456 Transcript_6553/m.20456 type:complete len:229 (-) Transcript_6553:23-709(-)